MSVDDDDDDLHSLCGATLFGSHQRHSFLPIWQRLVRFGFRLQRVGSSMHLRKVAENFDRILSRLWTKVHEIFRRHRKPLVFPKPFPDCLCHVSFRRYSPLSLEVVEKKEQMQKFCGPNFCGRDGSDFCTAVC